MNAAKESAHSVVKRLEGEHAQTKEEYQQALADLQKAVSSSGVAEKRNAELEKQLADASKLLAEQQDGTKGQVQEAVAMCAREYDDKLQVAKDEHDKDVARHEKDMKAMNAAKESAHSVVKRLESEKQTLSEEHMAALQSLTKRLGGEKAALQKQVADLKQENGQLKAFASKPDDT